MESSELYYMKDEVYFEPLFNNWYAWPYLIPPAQCSRYTVATHLRLMKSFVKNHDLHIAGSKQLVGGEFLACAKEQISDVKKIIDNTELKYQDVIKLSESIELLDELLREHKTGKTIEPLYSKLPDQLKGYIEIFMDLEHHPSYRIIECLLYRSDLYKEELQTSSFGLITKVAERPFILSTPRISDENHLHLDLQFNSPELERILASRDRPLRIKEITELFEGHRIAGGLNYMEMFTKQPPKKNHTNNDGSLKLQYIGHAGFLIETSNKTILIDPVVPSLDCDSEMKMLTYSDLPSKIDYICLTHSHSDHTQLETLLQLRHKTSEVLVPKNNGGSLSDPSLKLLLKQLHFNVTEFEDFDEVALPQGKITSIPFIGEHGDLNVRSKTAWLLQVGEKKLLFGADSTCLEKEMYSKIHNVIGDLDLLAIGTECIGAPYTWLYGALHSKKVDRSVKESRRLNGCDGTQVMTLVDIFSPKQVYIYALGIEPCFKYFMGLEYSKDSRQIVESEYVVNKCTELGVVAKALVGSQQIELVE